MMWCLLLIALLLGPETTRGANHHTRQCDILTYTTRTPGPSGQSIYAVIDKVTVATNDREVSKNNAAMDKVAVSYAGSLWHDGEKIICPLLNSNGRWIDTPFTKGLRDTSRTCPKKKNSLDERSMAKRSMGPETIGDTVFPNRLPWECPGVAK
jgi:hypothetical protein